LKKNHRKTPFMNKALFPIAVALLLCAATTRAQDHQPHETSPHEASSDPFTDNVNIGFGFGQDYGGFGGNVTVYPQKNIGLFVSGGYALAGFGYNAGIKLRALPNNGRSIVRPFLEAMYGYNAAVAVANDQQYNKLFYGPTVGAGLDIGRLAKNKGYLSLAILVPIRSPDVDNYINGLQTNYDVSFNNNLLPITFSIGYKFVLN
jgi:hypothetical protein